MYRSSWVTLAAAWLALCSVTVLAERAGWDTAGALGIVDLDHSVFQLHARVDYPMTPAISNALRDGVDLIFDVDARVERSRRFWLNSTVVDLTLRRELAYHTVSDRYVVRDPATNDQQTFATLEAACSTSAQSMRGRSWSSPSSSQAHSTSSASRAGIHRGASIVLVARTVVLDR